MKFVLPVAITSSVLITLEAYAQTCRPAPDCAALGYSKTESECSGRAYTVCPFDMTKYSCDTTSCEDLGFTDTIAECPGEYNVCQYDTTKGKCLGMNDVGRIAYFPTNIEPPKGWIKADGLVHSPAVYPDLFAKIGMTTKALDGYTDSTLASEWFKIPSVVSSDSSLNAYIYAGRVCEECKSQHLSGCSSGLVNAPGFLALENGIYKCIYWSGGTSGKFIGRLAAFYDSNGAKKDVSISVTTGYQSGAQYAVEMCTNYGKYNEGLDPAPNYTHKKSMAAKGTYEPVTAGNCYAYGSAIYECTSTTDCTIVSTCTGMYKAFCGEREYFAIY